MENENYDGCASIDTGRLIPNSLFIIYDLPYVKGILEYISLRRMKPTDILTNHPNTKFKPTCKNGDPCHVSAPRGSRTGTQGIKGAKDRSLIPDELCDHIVDICEEYIL